MIETKFEKACQILGKKSLDTVRERYEQSFDPESNYQYHKVFHSSLVARRFHELAKDILEKSPRLLSPEDIAFGIAVAKGHDRRIAWYHNQLETGIEGYSATLMKRLIGTNEDWSAAETIEDMRETSEKHCQVIFTPDHEKLCWEAYKVTIPGFSVEHKTVIQPFLTPETSLLARLIALSDLGSSGLNVYKYLEDGDELFREENIDILRMLQDSSSLLFTDSKVQDHIRGRMLSWSHNQVVFALGRKALLEEEITGVSEPVKQILRGNFTHFQESAESSKAKAERREDMNLFELIDDFGYTTKDSRKHLFRKFMV